MPVYNVTLQIFAATGVDYQIKALSREAAEEIARRRAEKDYMMGALDWPELQEVAVNSTVEVDNSLDK